MPMFTRKSSTFEARQFTTNNDAFNFEMDSLVAWIAECGGIARHDCTDIYIDHCGQHELRASVGDWIIHHGSDLFFPVKPDLFVQHFERVECDHKWEPIDDSKYDQCLLCEEIRKFEMQYFGDEVL